MPDALLERATKAIEIAKKLGANDVFSSIYRARSVSCSVRNGKLEKVEESTSRGLSLALYVDGRYSTNSTTVMTEPELEDFVKNAIDITKLLAVDEYRKLPDPELFAAAPPDDLDLIDASIPAIDHDRRLDMCQRMNSRMAGKERVLSASSSVSSNEVTSAAAASNGFAGSYSSTNISLYGSVTLEGEGDRRPEDGMGMGGHHLGDLWKPEDIGDEALRRARARLGSAKGPTMTGTMVVDRMAAASLIYRLLGPARGGSVQQKRSMWIDKLGKQAVSRKLTITSDPLIPRARGSRPYDGEGITSFRMPVIEKGKLRNYFIDTYSGRKLDMKPTSGGWGNLVFALGKRDRDAIIGAHSDGVYVTSWLGGNSDGSTGDFSLGLRGHRITKGKIGEPIGEMNVTGNLLDLFSNLREVGNDPWTHGSVHTPTLVFSKVQFSGA